MSYKVNLLEEMPNALFYLIESVEALQSKVNALQHKQASNSPKWVDIDELCAYLSSHPVKQTVYGWGSAKQIPVHKINKALVFLQSEIDDWLKNKSHKTVSKPEQSVKVDYDEKTVYNGIAKKFLYFASEALSVVKKYIRKQQMDTLPFSLWFPKLIELFKQKSKTS